ncbi:MAG: hypothetical protein ACXWP6_08995 [Ktedonobacterales bacterium]
MQWQRPNHVMHDVRLPQEVLPDAANGEEMVASVRRHTPDIVSDGRDLV